ncbi:hypothetical protein BOTBODRAFT_40710 [Botryobasidium botryosum FD-172 SS1]|uniref:Uncharacterized protein n=1 Tax=Botryobasidium botryosum (strain FD-172 SS1) TaxID=930990 RepID=A0A067N8W8_BOTB1|nr:hypothetical protein BOTBODRAFT_40710 [Botryobasidium botryosum FD-172 SS1]
MRRYESRPILMAIGKFAVGLGVGSTPADTSASGDAGKAQHFATPQLTPEPPRTSMTDKTAARAALGRLSATPVRLPLRGAVRTRGDRDDSGCARQIGQGSTLGVPDRKAGRCRRFSPTELCGFRARPVGHGCLPSLTLLWVRILMHASVRSGSTNLIQGSLLQ